MAADPKVKALNDLNEALDNIDIYLANREDVVDGDYGQPDANEEMRLLHELRSTRSLYRAALRAEAGAVGWISVDDAKPEYRERVWTARPNYEGGLTYAAAVYWGSPDDWDDGLKWQLSGDASGGDYVDNVTHWQRIAPVTPRPSQKE